ncbi:phosphate transport system permease protein [Roseinatronobacter thiooxidans]|uniref:Phosphate transport system permease protein n=1 Tax=Roseinatronobacter thiooxidans TaxID=121821 RepID=A0A2W7QEV4_9RHOB|nr:ABC transporter permease subunit [Roseinatronobacter thiooxidans]PZX45936.1 phosphate transport system permease protein [Roseinatronobacter thiooxidans]
MSDMAPTTSERGAAARKRRMTTRTSVVLGEKLAGGIITVGGLMVIVAVLGIMVFLFRVVMPLMAGGEMHGNVRHQLSMPAPVAWVNGDEFQTLGIVADTSGNVLTYHIPTGTEVTRTTLDFDGAEVTSVAGTLERDRVAFGFDDGSVRFATLGFESRATARNRLPSGLIQIDARDRMLDGFVYTEVGTGDFRTNSSIVELRSVEQVSDAPIVALDYRIGGTAERPIIVFATVDAAGQVRVSRSRVQINMMTGDETVTTTTTDLPSLGVEAGEQVTGLLMSGSADRIIISSDSGYVYRYDLRNIDAPVLAERIRVADDGVGVTALTFLTAEDALVVGTDDGGVAVWFRLQTGTTATTDGREMVRARTHAPMPAAVIDVSESQRSKEFVATDIDGNVWVYHSTSDQVLFRLARSGATNEQAQGMLFPRADGVMVVNDTGEFEAWQYTQKHPEVTLRVLFGRIWYEGYGQPEFIWQSTAGTDLSEPKYSLVPLIFGTIKAATYAMLFAVPIALMAAIYTSEFVDSRVRGTVKPMMEMMESLPTVVLGFIAALVLAPLVEEWIGAVLLGFFALPMGLMIGAFAWQALPANMALKYDGFPKFVLMGLSILVTAWVAASLGASFERVLFYGDFKGWTTGRIGTGTPFMFLILLPLSYLVVGWAFRKLYGHHWRALIGGMARSRAGLFDAGRWVSMLLGAMLLSYAFASFLTLIGYDPRGSFIDSYQQRNALVVGFIMAFAVIPNIYTLAEDALNSVPGHLRAASLACGATPWQTARWVVLPTAASGVFSAVMMGMGRAVGETMIVVMAAGNTPIMEWNIFSGLRTLSANIAIELPEAVKDGTNYRVLFLAALTLFIMTFVINTGAELIRQRFRKRAFNL